MSSITTKIVNTAMKVASKIGGLAQDETERKSEPKVITAGMP